MGPIMNAWRRVNWNAFGTTVHNIPHTCIYQLIPWRRNPKVHHRMYKSPKPIPILSQLDPVYTPPASLAKIHYGLILPSTPLSSKWSLSHQNLVQFSVLPHACHMSRPPHSPWFDLPNNIWTWVHNPNCNVALTEPRSINTISRWRFDSDCASRNPSPDLSPWSTAAAPKYVWAVFA
jgi:hypothetical protein